MAFGEITLKGTLHYEQIMRSVLKEIGYDKKEKGMDFENCSCLVHVEKQEPEIATIVHLGKEEEDLGAGDQGHMFGYATDEWDPESLMPLTHMLASKICEKLAELRKNQEMPYLRPDCKSQITVEYKKEGSLIKPVRVFNVLISAQHDPSISLEDLRKVIKEKVIQAVIPPDLLDEKTIYHINPAGPFTVGGPVADAGLTGRKIIVDTYGGWAPHGGTI
jgi:S-adenosylmethionine synthetase